MRCALKSAKDKKVNPIIWWWEKVTKALLLQTFQMTRSDGDQEAEPSPD